MSSTLLKKDLKLILLKFIETRLLIIFIGAVGFALFPERGQDYYEKGLREIADIKVTWDRYDSEWYQRLAAEGYPQRPFTNDIQETWGFMPLYSIIINLVSRVVGGDLFWIGIAISNICSLVAMYFIYKVAQEQFKTGIETINSILICAGSFYLSVVYTEGLFVMLTALVFYFSFKKNYGWALIFAGLASITRIQGCLLYAIPAIEILRHHLKGFYKYIPAFLLSLLPMATFMLYLYNTCGEPLAFIKIQNAWASSSTYPLQGIINLFTDNKLGKSSVNTFFWVLILGFVLYNYRKMPLSYTVFTILYFLLSTSNELVYGTTRYMLGILPVFFAVSVSSTYLKQVFYLINVLFLAITICSFITNISSFI